MSVDDDGPPTRPLHPSVASVRGLAAAPGVAIGPALVFDRRSVHVARRSIPTTKHDDECRRLHEAIGRSRSRLEAVHARLDPLEDAEHRLVLEAHLLMHGDALVVSAAEAAVREGRSAEWALRHVADGLVARLAASRESYLRERARDVEHVVEDILRELTGAPSALPEFAEPSVLIASDLSPAEVLALPRSQTLALVTELGTSTGHTAILARALRIPTIVGARGATRAIEPSDVVIVDARRGEVRIRPSDDERRVAEEHASRFRSLPVRLGEACEGPARLVSGETVTLLANIEVEVEVEEARRSGVDGVGLYRTEFLYLDGTVPDEEQLTELFTRVVRAFDGRPVTLRSFDLGSDKLTTDEAVERTLVGKSLRTVNPALGLRGLRLALAAPDVFRAQLRAILRAAQHGPVRLMFPMVCTVEDYREARAQVEAAARDLEAAGLAYGRVAVGAMIEVPSAVALVDVLARECAFFSVGTNDLAQYALAVDRSDPAMAPLASPLAPAVLRLLPPIVEAARSHSLPVSVCGDMAAHPLALPVLLGLGFDALSMPATEVPFARAIVRRLDGAALRELGRTVLRCATEAEVRRAVVESLGHALGDLWDEHGLVL